MADQKAVRLYLKLYAGDPERFREATQTAMYYLGVDLRDLGHREDDVERELSRLVEEAGQQSRQRSATDSMPAGPRG